MLTGLASAYGRAGRYGEALSRAEEAVERTLAAREYVHVGHAYLRVAAIHRERGKPFFDDSESAYRKALDRAAKHGMRPPAAECHEGLGRLNLRRGLPAPARKEVAAAA